MAGNEGKPPQAPFEITVRINAESWPYAQRAIAELVGHFEDHRGAAPIWRAAEPGAATA
jgi:hypothetical protein